VVVGDVVVVVGSVVVVVVGSVVVVVVGSVVVEVVVVVAVGDVVVVVGELAVAGLERMSTLESSPNVTTTRTKPRVRLVWRGSFTLLIYWLASNS
jgi:hypothetical protein